MLIYILLLILGLLLIVFGAEYFVAGSSMIARRFGIPKLIIGLTIVAIGTSAPEFAVNVMASIHGHSQVALGNILGSNIANILLVFAIAMLFVKKATISKSSLNQIYISVYIALLLFFFAIFFSGLSLMMILQIEGLILLLLGFLYWFYLYKITKSDKERLEDENISDNKLSKVSSFPIVLVITVVSLVALLYGSNMATNNAVLIAQYFGVSELVIAGTIIAIGTSLPELVTSIHAARQKHFDLLLGNVIGSNIVNTLFILGTSVVIRPIVVTREAMPYLYMNIIVPILLILGFTIFAPRVFKRWQAFVLLGLYVIFLIFIL